MYGWVDASEIVVTFGKIIVGSEKYLFVTE